MDVESAVSDNVVALESTVELSTDAVPANVALVLAEIVAPTLDVLSDDEINARAEDIPTVPSDTAPVATIDVKDADVEDMELKSVDDDSEEIESHILYLIAQSSPFAVALTSPVVASPLPAKRIEATREIFA